MKTQEPVAVKPVKVIQHTDQLLTDYVANIKHLHTQAEESERIGKGKRKSVSMQKEVWKDVVGWEGLYWVSSIGRVSTMPYGLMNPVMQNSGYYSVMLYKNGHGKWRKVGRLVAEAFLPNPQNYPLVCHRNSIKTDDRLKNLEWGNASRAHKNSYAAGRQAVKGVMNGRSVLTEEQVLEIRKLCRMGLPQRHIAANYGISQMTVSLVHRRKSWKHI